MNDFEGVKAVDLPWHSLGVLRLPVGFLELALGKARIEAVLNVPVAGEVLLETGEPAHPVLVVLKVGEVLEGLGVGHTLFSAQSSEVINRLEEDEVRQGDLIAADELLSLQALDNGSDALSCTCIYLRLIFNFEGRHYTLVNGDAVDQGEHLVDLSLFLRC